MKIPLDLIEPSPNPVRTTWDEEKMDELVQSIQEQGLIVPIKVRPLKDIGPCDEHGMDWLEGLCQHYDSSTGYNRICKFCFEMTNAVEWEEDEEGDERRPIGPLFQIVYGHRRTEAARRAGLIEIDAVVEETADDDALVQALIENVQREDMAPQDELAACEQIMAMTGMSWKDLSRNGVLPRGKAQALRMMSNLPDDIQDVVGLSDSDKPLTLSHIRYAGLTATGDKGGNAEQNQALRDQKANVLRKAASEGLGTHETARVAAAVAAAPTEEAKKRLLEWEYSPVIHDPDLIRSRAAQYGAHDPMYRDTTPKKADKWEETPEVKAVIQGVIESAKRWNDLIKAVQEMSDIGKLSPESRQFVAHRARQLAQRLTDWAAALEDKNGN